MLKKLNDAMDYIEAHLEDEFLLEKISEHINVFCAYQYDAE